MVSTVLDGAAPTISTAAATVEMVARGTAARNRNPEVALEAQVRQRRRLQVARPLMETRLLLTSKLTSYLQYFAENLEVNGFSKIVTE
jgi:hypothetical protein